MIRYILLRKYSLRNISQVNDILTFFHVKSKNINVFWLKFQLTRVKPLV